MNTQFESNQQLRNAKGRKIIETIGDINHSSFNSAEMPVHENSAARNLSDPYQLNNSQHVENFNCGVNRIKFPPFSGKITSCSEMVMVILE